MLARRKLLGTHKTNCCSLPFKQCFAENFPKVDDQSQPKVWENKAAHTRSGATWLFKTSTKCEVWPVAAVKPGSSAENIALHEGHVRARHTGGCVWKYGIPLHVIKETQNSSLPVRNLNSYTHVCIEHMCGIYAVTSTSFQTSWIPNTPSFRWFAVHLNLHKPRSQVGQIWRNIRAPI